MLKRSAVALTLVALLVGAGTAQGETAKNVILMISDGIGFNGWEAAKYYQGGLPYDNDDFTFYGMSTYMNNVMDNTTGQMLDSDSSMVKGMDSATQDWTAVPQGYDKGKMWTDFEYHRSNESYNGFTDSAAAATAMYTGTKTYNSAVSYDVNGQPLKTIAEIAADMGKATGVVSSVQFSHATPAAVDAHTFYRYNKTAIAEQMKDSDLDVIMGGDAYVDSVGEYPGAVAGWVADASAAGFSIVDEADLGAVADGTYNGGTIPTKVASVFKGDTLNNAGTRGGLEGTLTLETMTKAALKVLEQDPSGFHLTIEGGAIDWANHANNVSDMMREQVDFDNSVAAVMDWVEANGGWGENLLIVTSDHECGSIWGPGSGLIDVNNTPDDPTDDVSVFTNVVDNGSDQMPDAEYYSGGHTNALVPLWARGAGSEEFAELVEGTDEVAGSFWTQFGGTAGWDGQYVDNTAVFTVMNEVVPEPATMALLGLGGLVIARRRRRSA